MISVISSRSIIVDVVTHEITIHDDVCPYLTKRGYTVRQYSTSKFTDFLPPSPNHTNVVVVICGSVDSGTINTLLQKVSRSVVCPIILMCPQNVSLEPETLAEYRVHAVLADTTTNANIQLNIDLAHTHHTRQTRPTMRTSKELERMNESERLALIEFTLDHALDGFHIVSPEGKFLSINGASSRMFGYSKEELLGMSVRDLYPELTSGMWEQHRTNSKSGSPITIEHALVKKDGSRILVEIQANRIVFNNREYFCSVVRDITERKRQEHALNQNRYLLNESQRMASVGTWFYDLNTGISSCTEETYRLFGLLPSSSPDPELFLSVLHPDDKQQLVFPTESSGFAQNTFEFRVCHSDGTIRTLRAKSELIRDKERQLHAIITTVQDVSRQIENENELRKRKAQYRSLFDEAIEGIYRTDLHGVISVANPSFARMVGDEAPNQLIGQSVLQYYTDPNDWKKTIEFSPGATGQQTLELSWKKKSGEVISVELHGRIVTDDNTGTTYYQGFARDITAFKLSTERQAQLQQYNAQLELIIEGTRLGFWDWNPQDNSVRFNNRWAEMLGHDLSEIKQELSEWSSRVHPDDLASCYADIQRHINGQLPYYENVHRMRHKDGHWVYILDRGKIFERDELGRPTRFCGTHTDISKEKEAEQQALEANRSKTQFLANMSHELRTPLNAVLGLSEALIDHTYGPLTDKQERSLRTIHTSGKHLLSLINDVLDIARIEAGKLTVDPREVVWSQFSAECVAFVQDQAETKEQSIVVENDHTLSFFSADPRRLRQVLINLMSNSIKFCQRGAKISLGGRTVQNTQEIEIWVTDNGPGIDPSQHQRIFEPFFMLDSSLSREQGGAGLGLALVKRFIELHRGKIRVESDIGKGAKFYYYTPKVHSK